MTFDLNPKFTTDAKFVEDARRVANFLWETTNGQPHLAPDSYCESLRYDYADGSVSYLNLLNRIQFDEEPTFEEFSEMVEALLYTDARAWPPEGSIEAIKANTFLYDEPEKISFSEFDFAEGDMGSKIEKFLKKVIASVYTDGVTRVTDEQGNPPSPSNNYLMADDGKSFSGIFFDLAPGQAGKKFPFEIKEKTDGTWSISY